MNILQFLYGIAILGCILPHFLQAQETYTVRLSQTNAAAGEHCRISWYSPTPDSVTLQYWDIYDAQWHSIAESIHSSQNVYEWTLPSLPYTTHIVVKVQSMTYPNKAGTSYGYLTLQADNSPFMKRAQSEAIPSAPIVQGLQLYPTPTSTAISIAENIELPLEIECYDIHGGAWKLVNNHRTFSVSHLPNGVYTAHIPRENGIYTLSFIVQK